MKAPPLRTKKKNGTVYQRFRDVEATINTLYELTSGELIARCKLPHSDPGFVPMQCLVHFARHKRNDRALFRLLFEVLAARLRKIRIAKLLPDFEDHTLESAFDQFWMLIAGESHKYEERLDYFEVNFRGAYSNLLLDEQRRHTALASHHAPPPASDDEDESPIDGEAFDDSVFETLDLKMRWKVACERMTQRQRLAVKWRRQGVPVEASDPDALSISKILQKTPKTIRGDLKKAYAIFVEVSEEGANV